MLMRLTADSRFARGAAGLAVLLAVAIGAYGLYLVAIGPVVMIVPEGADPNGPAVRQVRIPVESGWIAIVGGSLVFAGLVTRRLVAMWIGAAVIAGFATLFLFGVSGALLPVVPVLFILLAVVSLAWRRESTARH